MDIYLRSSGKPSIGRNNRLFPETRPADTAQVNDQSLLLGKLNTALPVAAGRAFGIDIDLGSLNSSVLEVAAKGNNCFSPDTANPFHVVLCLKRMLQMVVTLCNPDAAPTSFDLEAYSVRDAVLLCVDQLSVDAIKPQCRFEVRAAGNKFATFIEMDTLQKWQSQRAEEIAAGIYKR